ncbi:hypothetical protein MKZ38_000625 [Zalerion maritima]|uniref:Uncharacterized protein n=1 Tax=Zalerion maritima TaxID=339359 RepID=A0AAD5RR73_9PEZI|nr:hypothetical protein MKZ38_000625 [Zalerion maritima]
MYGMLVKAGKMCKDGDYISTVVEDSISNFHIELSCTKDCLIDGLDDLYSTSWCGSEFHNFRVAENGHIARLLLWKFPWLN